MSTKREAKETVIDKEKSVEILSVAYGYQIEALKQHTELAYKIFSWSTTLLLAIIGYIFSQSTQLNSQNRLFLGCAVTLIVVTVYWWQRQNHLESVDHAENVARIDKVFHLTEAGYFGGTEAIYKRRWHLTVPTWQKRIGLFTYNVVLILMGLLVLVVLWKV